MEEGELSGGDEILVTDLKLSSTLGSPVPGTTGRGNSLARKKWSGCIKFDDFRLEEKVGEGTFGVVHKAVHRRTGRMVALKKILTRPEQEGFPITALREIKLLKLVRHPNTMSITDIAVTSNNNADDGGVYMVFDYMDHDLTGLLESPEIRFSLPQIKLYMKQLLSGLKYLHSVDILHRDIKGANLLLNNSGELKITDFGLARPVEEGRVHYTPGVVTRWYRPPELLFGATKYGSSVDMWGAGCILGEMLIKKPLLPGDSDLHQLELIAQLCGTPSEETMPGCSSLPDFAKVKLPMCKRRILDAFAKPDRLAADLMDKLLQLDPAKRLTAAQALEHEFFKSAPPAALPSDLPIYPSKHEFTCQRAAPDTEASRHLRDAPHPTPHLHGQNSFEATPLPPPPPPPVLPGHRYMTSSKRNEPDRTRDSRDSRDRRERSRSRDRRDRSRSRDARSRDRRVSDRSRDRSERDSRDSRRERSRDRTDRDRKEKDRSDTKEQTKEKSRDRSKAKREKEGEVEAGEVPESDDVPTENDIEKPSEKPSEPSKKREESSRKRSPSPRPRSPRSPRSSRSTSTRRPSTTSTRPPRPRSPLMQPPMHMPPAAPIMPYEHRGSSRDPVYARFYDQPYDDHDRSRGYQYDSRGHYPPQGYYPDDRRHHDRSRHYDDPRHHYDDHRHQEYRAAPHKRQITSYSGVEYHAPSEQAQAYDMYGFESAEPEPKRHDSSRRSSDAGRHGSSGEKPGKIPTYSSDRK